MQTIHKSDSPRRITTVSPLENSKLISRESDKRLKWLLGFSEPMSYRSYTKAFHLLWKRGWTERHCSHWRIPWCANRRYMSECSYDQSKSSDVSVNTCLRSEGMDSSDFEKWHNGGGFFHKSAHIDPTAVIEIGAIVHSKSVLGANVRLGSGAIVGPSVIIGHSTEIGYNAALSNCSVGFSCVIHNGVCIGQDGFGFFVDEQGNLLKKPQMMCAKIGNHVEIGANSCIDRGSWRDTVIGDHTKIDNLVQIGHNVVLGKCCMLCGQVGIAGSATMGDYVTLGGKVAVRDHVSIASKVRLAANSCVTKDIIESGDYGGFPAVPIHEWRRQVATLRRICKKDMS